MFPLKKKLAIYIQAIAKRLANRIKFSEQNVIEKLGVRQ